MERADFEKVINETENNEELRVMLIDMAEEYLDMRINNRSGLKKVKGHINDYFNELENPTPPLFANDGWVKVVGVTVPYVGTGLSGKGNKIFLGAEAVLPQTIASQLINDNKVKEIK